MDFKDSLRDIKSQMLENDKNSDKSSKTAARTLKDKNSGLKNGTKENSKENLGAKLNLNQNSNTTSNAPAVSQSSQTNDEKAYYANLERKKESLLAQTREFLNA